MGWSVDYKSLWMDYIFDMKDHLVNTLITNNFDLRGPFFEWNRENVISFSHLLTGPDLDGLGSKSVLLFHHYLPDLHFGRTSFENRFTEKEMEEISGNVINFTADPVCDMVVYFGNEGLHLSGWTALLTIAIFLVNVGIVAGIGMCHCLTKIADNWLRRLEETRQDVERCVYSYHRSWSRR